MQPQRKSARKANEKRAKGYVNFRKQRELALAALGLKRTKESVTTQTEAAENYNNAVLSNITTQTEATQNDANAVMRTENYVNQETYREHCTVIKTLREEKTDWLQQKKKMQ